jgi:hypothetical protein
MKAPPPDGIRGVAIGAIVALLGPLLSWAIIRGSTMSKLGTILVTLSLSCLLVTVVGWLCYRRFYRISVDDWLRTSVTLALGLALTSGLFAVVRRIGRARLERGDWSSIDEVLTATLTLALPAMAATLVWSRRRPRGVASHPLTVLLCSIAAEFVGLRWLAPETCRFWLDNTSALLGISSGQGSGHFTVVQEPYWWAALAVGAFSAVGAQTLSVLRAISSKRGQLESGH